MSYKKRQYDGFSILCLAACSASPGQSVRQSLILILGTRFGEL